jgi:hypothetical protein
MGVPVLSPFVLPLPRPFSVLEGEGDRLVPCWGGEGEDVAASEEGAAMAGGVGGAVMAKSCGGRPMSRLALKVSGVVSMAVLTIPAMPALGLSEHLVDLRLLLVLEPPDPLPKPLGDLLLGVWPEELPSSSEAKAGEEERSSSLLSPASVATLPPPRLSCLFR